MAQPEKVIKVGFFNMETVTAICNAGDIKTAREIAVDRVNKTKQHATPENVRKAISMIERASTVNKLGIAVSNWMLAHPSENLKSIR